MVVWKACGGVATVDASLVMRPRESPDLHQAQRYSRAGPAPVL